MYFRSNKGFVNKFSFRKHYILKYLRSIEILNKHHIIIHQSSQGLLSLAVCNPL